MKILEIRNLIKKHEESVYYGDMEDVAEKVEELYHDEELNVRIVNSDTEDRGDDWKQWDVRVYKVDEGSEVAYFKVAKEVEKTPRYSGPGAVVVNEVIPKQVTVTVYPELRLGDI